MGGVRYKELLPKETGLVYVVYAYYFGKPHEQVLEIRKSWGLAIRG